LVSDVERDVKVMTVKEFYMKICIFAAVVLLFITDVLLFIFVFLGL
jgi:hypothetical protein